jgi:SUMO ligase MMS21 Smc5/6 complex component
LFIFSLLLVSVNPNKNQLCTHTISKEAADAMLAKKNIVACPVAGCSGKWMKNHIVSDENFLRKLKKFQKQQTLRSQLLGTTLSQKSNAVAAITLDD